MIPFHRWGSQGSKASGASPSLHSSCPPAPPALGAHAEPTQGDTQRLLLGGPTAGRVKNTEGPRAKSVFEFLSTSFYQLTKCHSPKKATDSRNRPPVIVEQPLLWEDAVFTEEQLQKGGLSSSGASETLA